MNCAICKKNEASVSLKHQVDGEDRDLHVCEACAEKHGLSVQLPIPLLTDFLFGVPSELSSGSSDKDSSCPGCHMHSKDLAKSSLLGCPQCYSVFSVEVGNMLENVQRGAQHFGKVPRANTKQQILHFEHLLAVAVEREDFDSAARLRDLLADLNAAGAGVMGASEDA